MKVEKYSYPKSSFLSVEKDLSIITNYILQNERLKKLLYYTTPDCLTKPKLTDEQSIEVLRNNIKLVPKLYVDKEVLNYLIITMDNFVENPTNPQFRNNLVEFDIVCHADQWNLGDFQLRPYRIAAEIDSMLDKRHLTGIGDLQFYGANQILLNSEFIGVCLLFITVHGEEDRKFAPQEETQEDIENNFDAIFNAD